MTYCYFCKGDLKDPGSFERYDGANKTKKYYCEICKINNNLKSYPITIFEVWNIKDEEDHFDRLYKAELDFKINDQDFLVEIHFNAPHETWIYPVRRTALGIVTSGAVLVLKGAPITPNNIMNKLPLYLIFS